MTIGRQVMKISTKYTIYRATLVKGGYMGYKIHKHFILFHIFATVQNVETLEVFSFIVSYSEYDNS